MATLEQCPICQHAFRADPGISRPRFDFAGDWREVACPNHPHRDRRVPVVIPAAITLTSGEPVRLEFAVELP